MVNVKSLKEGCGGDDDELRARAEVRRYLAKLSHNNRAEPTSKSFLILIRDTFCWL